MTITRRTSHLSDMLTLRSAMDRIFDDTIFRPVTARPGDDTLAMPLDIRSTQDALVIEAALPGVRPEDVDIQVLGDTLTLTASSGAAPNENKGSYHVREVHRGRFSRTVTLPIGLRTDAASATFEHGILSLAIPRAEQARPRHIPVMAPTPIAGASIAATPIAATPIAATPIAGASSVGTDDATHTSATGDAPVAG